MGDFILNIPDEEHKKLKFLSVERDKSMKDIIIELISKEVNKEKEE